jgi:hypothetical protein
MLIIDEIGTVSSNFLHSIENRCNVMKNVDPNSTAILGGLHAVIALGDFHQFSPIHCGSIKQTPPRNEANCYGTCSRSLQNKCASCMIANIIRC